MAQLQPELFSTALSHFSQSYASVLLQNDDRLVSLDIISVMLVLLLLLKE